MTARQLQQRFDARAAAVSKEFRQASRGIAISARKLSREKMTEGIYSQPIPRRPKSGKPQWRRTGHLRRSEDWEIRGDAEVAIINRAVYGEPRHEAGKPGRRPVRYVSHWQDEMAEVMRPLALEIWHEALLDVLNTRQR